MCTNSPIPATSPENVSSETPNGDYKVCRYLQHKILPELERSLKGANLKGAAAHITHMQLLIYKEWNNRKALLCHTKNP